MKDRLAADANADRTSGAQKKVLVGVRVPEPFHRRIQTELVRRDLSLQQMIVDALALYFKSPLDWDYAATTYVQHDAGDPESVMAERDAWMGLWVKYISQMPPEKVEVLTRVMEWDLRTLKSSRRKPAKPLTSPRKLPRRLRSSRRQSRRSKRRRAPARG